LDWLGREREAVRADLDAQLAVLKTEEADLLAACDRRDEDCAAMSEQVDTLTRAHNTVTGQLTEVTKEGDRPARARRQRERDAARGPRAMSDRGKSLLGQFQPPSSVSGLRTSNSPIYHFT
jgi:hypothetical protein